MRFWKPEPINESAQDPVAAAHAMAVREAYARGRRDERARHRNSPLIAAAFGLAGLIGAALLIGAVLRTTYTVDSDVQMISNKVVAQGVAQPPPVPQKPNAG